MSIAPLAIDLFCGRGGWTRGLQAAGFRCVGYDIEPRMRRFYPGELVLQDVATLDGRMFRGGVDFIIGSPPCTEFSNATLCRRALESEKGMGLVRHFLRVVKEAGGVPWAMENVTGLAKYLHLTPLLRFRHSLGGVRYLWGDFDAPLMPDYFSARGQCGNRRADRKYYPNRYEVRDPWKRAEIEPVISGAIGHAAMATVEARRRR